MAIAMGRFGRFKRYIIGSIIGFFVGIKNRIIRAIRGRSNEENDIALEVNDADLFPGPVSKLRSPHLHKVTFYIEYECFKYINRNIFCNSV